MKFVRLSTFAGIFHKVGKHNEIGCKWNEATYQVELAQRLGQAGRAFVREIPVRVTFEQFSKTYKVDLLVLGAGIYELKTVKAIDNVHIGQVLNYLRLLNATRAKIVNFRTLSVESKFVNSNDTLRERRAFDLDSGEYRGPDALRHSAIGMLNELGTKLSVSLYNQCMLANVGKLIPVRCLPDANVTQFFQMIEDAEAFTITAIESQICHHREHLRKMASKARLNAFHWINVKPKVVRFETAGFRSTMIPLPRPSQEALSWRNLSQRALLLLTVMLSLRNRQRQLRLPNSQQTNFLTPQSSNPSSKMPAR